MTKLTLNPKTGYVVSAALDFTNDHEATFVNYYLPLMSPNALGLFSALKGQLRPQPMISSRQPVTQLLAQLNIGLPAMTEALHQLEAVGLIKTFTRTDEMGEVVVFELHPTLTPAEFIKDDLLSVQLLQMVGPERFKQLSEEAVANYLDVDDLENVSHSFFEVFHPDREGLGNDPVITTAQQRVDQATARRVTTDPVQNKDFDLHFVAQQLSGADLDAEIVNQYRRLILVEHETYGYDEMAIAKLLERSIDVVNNQFDPEQFKLLARNTDAKRSTSAADQKQVAAATELDMAGLPDEVKELLTQCEQQAPMAFLAQLKQQTNGYVSSNERYTVERLVNQSKLSNGAINLLLWYIIGEQGLATVKASLADAIANNWGRAGVQTSVDAFNEIQRHQEAREQRQNSRRQYRRNGQKGSIKEKLPEWAQKGYQPKAKAASAEQLAESKRLLAELHKNRKKRQNR